MNINWLLPDGAFQVSQDVEKRSQAVTIGCAAASLASLLGILSAATIDDPLRNAAFCLSASLPLSICNAMFSWNIISFPASTKILRRLARIVGFVGWLALFLALTLIFQHFSVWHAVVFDAASLGSFLAWSYHSAVLKKVVAGSRQVPLTPEEAEL